MSFESAMCYDVKKNLYYTNTATFKYCKNQQMQLNFDEKLFAGSCFSQVKILLARVFTIWKPNFARGRKSLA